MIWAAILLLIASSIITYRVPDRFYVPVALALMVAFVGLGVASGLGLPALGVSHQDLKSGLIWGGACVGVMGVIYGFGISVPRLEPLFADKRAQEASARQITSKALVDVPLGTVLLEEVAFRGVIFGLFQQQWGTVWAVAGSSLLFGLWHVLPSLSMHESHAMGAVLGTGWRGRVTAVGGTILATGAAGVVFAMLRVWSGSVLAPMGLHWAMNSFGSLAAWWVGRRASRREHRRALQHEIGHKLGVAHRGEAKPSGKTGGSVELGIPEAEPPE